MKRAVVLAGWQRAPEGLALREYAVLALPRLPGRSFAAWKRLAAEMDVELSASWLLLRTGTGKAADEVQEGFAGCLTGVADARVRRTVQRLDAAASRSRVLTDFGTIERRCARLRQAGTRIVFTNGVFDLFHVGHLRLLRSARALGGALVVGINSDDSARKLKGRSRPVVSQFARAEIVAGVRGVVLCAVFDQGDPRELLRAVRPDVLVKGSEYSPARVVGKALVESWGGRVHRVPHVSGWSSTGLMRVVRGTDA
jgi:D-beta-D-heptose 7-phosphate kinase/D-beta-D-heptose 1-phosphate adenosyltransferase